MFRSKWLALAALVAVAVAAVVLVRQEGRFAAYTGSGYSIRYPKDWRVADFPMVDAAFLAPAGQEPAPFQANVNIVVAMPGPGDANVEGQVAEIIESLDQPGNNFRLLAKETFTIHGMNAVSLRYAVRANGIDIMATTFVINAGKAYIVSYASLEQDHDQYLPLVREMVVSFALN